MQRYVPSFQACHDSPTFHDIIEQVAKARVILIRHAKTVQNEIMAKLLEEIENGRETTLGDFVKVHSDTALTDCLLSEEGKG